MITTPIRKKEEIERLKNYFFQRGNIETTQCLWSE